MQGIYQDITTAHGMNRCKNRVSAVTSVWLFSTEQSKVTAGITKDRVLS